LALTEAGARVVLYDQAAQAGGRARSFHEPALDRPIDNGNHLLLSGNHAALDYLSHIGAADRLTGPDSARFDFFEFDSGERWSIDLNRGPVPLWVLYSKRRVPGTSLGDYVKGLRLLTAGDRTVADLFARHGALYRRFWEPFAVAVLNTAPDQAVARLLVPVIRETLARGADASIPLIARRGLSDTFVDPALDALARRGAEIRLGCRVVGLEREDDRLTGLALARGLERLAPGDAAVLAAPPWTAAELLPGLTVPDAFAPIVNVHFRIEGRRPLLSTPVLGLVGGTAQWLFVRDDVASVTISAAHALAERPASEIAAIVWPEVARAIDRDAADMPPVRVVKERRATFLASPAQIARRPAPETWLRNLMLAGDYTDTGLPATIEGAIRSGRTAAKLVLR
ncbi:MAG: hydroxysqualene dehydroxylase HpnE, partial [Hyphomicrobiales bacterium]